MYRVRSDIFGIEETVTRPVLIQLKTDISKFLGISRNVYAVYDPEYPLKKVKDGTNVEVLNTIQDEYIEIEATEVSEENKELSLLIDNNDFKPIYQDKDIKTKLNAMHHERKMSLTYRYYSKSKAKIIAFVNKLRSYSATNALYMYHALEYHYVLPPIVIELVIEFNRLKNLQLEDKLTHRQYFKKYFDDRLEITHTVDGESSKSDLVIRERQNNVLGYIEDNVHELDYQYADNVAMWYIEFTYVVRYEKPITIISTYPMMIYNSVIDPKFTNIISYEQKISKPYADHTGRWIDPNLNRMVDKYIIDKDIGFIRIPKEDNIPLVKLPSYYNRVFTVLTYVDQTDPTMIFNINELEEIKLKKAIIRMLIESENIYIGKPYRSMFLLELYVDGNRRSDIVLTIDKLGNIRSNKELDPKHIYHFSFSIINDLNSLLPNDYKRIIDYLRSDYINILYKDINLHKGEPNLNTYIVGYDKFGDPIIKAIPENKIFTGYDEYGLPKFIDRPTDYAALELNKDNVLVYKEIPCNKVVIGTKKNGTVILGSKEVYKNHIGYLVDGVPLYGRDNQGPIIIGEDENNNPIYGFLDKAKVPVAIDNEGNKIYEFIPNDKVVIGIDENGLVIFKDKKDIKISDDGIIGYDKDGKPIYGYDDNNRPIIGFDKDNNPIYGDNDIINKPSDTVAGSYLDLIDIDNMLDMSNDKENIDTIIAKITDNTYCRLKTVMIYNTFASLMRD
ncbi:hypothetical protein ACVWU4_000892 [Campylobacter coli]